MTRSPCPCPAASRKSLQVAHPPPVLLAKSADGLADIEDLNAVAPCFTQKELKHIKSRLLNWYDRCHRQLPWRQPCLSPDSEQDFVQLQQQRAYATWVSEVMLQQTKIATVVDYFNRWMEKWPTVNHLAQATEEEVNALWAGLGYYRRARFLLEGAKQLVQLQRGLLPSSVEELQKIPGIGKYTAGAIASIAFNQPVPIVDGNVIRVLCRLKAISANPKASSTVKTLWSLAGQLVDAKRPGDLNQSLMELGATICSPAAPSCSSCPIAKSCDAFALSKVSSGSLDAVLVTNFPAKVVKASPRQDYVAVCVLEKGGSTVANMPRLTGSLPTGYFLLVKRPPTGLLAGLWEFPTVSLSGPRTSSKARTAAIDGYLKGLLGIDIGQHTHVMIARKTLGTYVHVFTHIRLHMVVEWMHISGHDESLTMQDVGIEGIKMKWVDASAMQDLGLTTGVRKVYKMFLDFHHAKLEAISNGSSKKRKR